MLNQQNFYRFFQRNSKGFSLIEVIIALALLGIIGVAFLGALATASKAIFIADERTTAESLARSQMEYVKSQPYSDNGTYEKIASAQIPEGYAIMSVNSDNKTVEEIIGVPWDSQNEDVDTDAGLQRIKLVIRHHDKLEVITLEGYKVKR